MTGLLAERARRVVAIELDVILAQRLKEKLSAESLIEILQGDVLTVDLAGICRRYEAEKCFVFGNLPYYITSPIIHRLFSFQGWIRSMALLIQREVALRLVAEPGTRAYGYLSVLARLYSRPRIAFTVPPGAFSPPPKVHSALVDFELRPGFPKPSQLAQGTGVVATHASPLQIADVERFLDFVKLCFAQKRKNLRNNLAGAYSRRRVERVLPDLALPSNVRAEQLAVEQFATLFQRLG